MPVEWEQSPVFSAGIHRRRRPTLEDRLIARMLAPWLDDELARGVAASASGAHAAGAEQLTGTRARRALSRSLDRLVDRTQNPKRTFLKGVAPPGCAPVRDAMPPILRIRSLLLSAQPLSAQGIARLKGLLQDRSSPCYSPSPQDALRIALEEIATLLDGS